MSPEAWWLPALDSLCLRGLEGACGAAMLSSGLLGVSLQLPAPGSGSCPYRMPAWALRSRLWTGVWVSERGLL